MLTFEPQINSKLSLKINKSYFPSSYHIKYLKCSRSVVETKMRKRRTFKHPHSALLPHRSQLKINRAPTSVCRAIMAASGSSKKHHGITISKRRRPAEVSPVNQYFLPGRINIGRDFGRRCNGLWRVLIRLRLGDK